MYFSFNVCMLFLSYKILSVLTKHITIRPSEGQRKKSSEFTKANFPTGLSTTTFWGQSAQNRRCQTCPNFDAYEINLQRLNIFIEIV